MMNILKQKLGKVHYSKTGFTWYHTLKGVINLNLQYYLGKIVKLTLTNNKVLVGKVTVLMINMIILMDLIQ